MQQAASKIESTLSKLSSLKLHYPRILKWFYRQNDIYQKLSDSAIFFMFLIAGIRNVIFIFIDILM